MKKVKNIKKLLDKYFEGNTSCKEEQELRLFFMKGHVPEDMTIYRPLFVYLDGESRNAPVKKEIKISHHNYYLRSVYGAIAASVLIVLGIGGYIDYTRQNASYVIINGEKCNNVELAKEQAQKAFSDVSFSKEEIANDLIPKDMKGNL